MSEIQNKKSVGRPRKQDGKYSKDKDVASDYQKQYYAKNKAQILNDMKEKVKCENCGHFLSKCNMLVHQKSFKCQASKHMQENDKVGKLVNEFYHLKKSKTAANKEVVETRLNELYDELHAI